MSDQLREARAALLALDHLTPDEWAQGQGAPHIRVLAALAQPAPDARLRDAARFVDEGWYASTAANGDVHMRYASDLPARLNDLRAALAAQPAPDAPYFAGGEPLTASASGIHRDTVTRMRERERRPTPAPRKCEVGGCLFPLAHEGLHDWAETGALAATPDALREDFVEGVLDAEFLFLEGIASDGMVTTEAVAEAFDRISDVLLGFEPLPRKEMNAREEGAAAEPDTSRSPGATGEPGESAPGGRTRTR